MKRLKQLQQRSIKQNETQNATQMLDEDALVATDDDVHPNMKVEPINESAKQLATRL